ncbi:MAG: CaiB/BaiF CoA transferase family protein [Alphaproteobacteria bacterium]
MRFEDLVVVDLATLAAAPQVATFFGDLGARVVKVEHPRGDPLRSLLDRGGAPLQWKIVNRNKECVALDPASAGDRALLERLLARADLLVANMTAERLARHALDARSLRARHPRLVAVNLTTWGTTGPWADRAGSGTLAEAASGLAWLTGEPGGPPGLSPVGLGDHLGVMQGIVAALVGLLERDATGADGASDRAEVRAFHDVAMLDPLLALTSSRIAAVARDGADPPRVGNRFPTVAPRNAYPTADGRWVALTAGTDELARRTLEVVGRGDLVADPRFADGASRVRHADELDAIVGGWIAARSCDDVVAAFAAARVSLAAIDPPSAVPRNPQVVARASLVEVDDPALGRVTLAAPPCGGTIRWLGRSIGADDAAIRAWLSED